MEDAGPQVADNATGISAEIAEDGTVSAETSGLVAPRKDGPARALQKWREHSQPRRLKQEQGARMLLPGARLESWRRVQHGRLQVVHEAGQAVYAVLRLHRVVWEPAQRASTARSEIAARAKRHGAGGYRGHVGRHGPRAVQCAPLHPHEVLPAGVHAAR